jgi:simple sugar transport system permease protein
MSQPTLTLPNTDETPSPRWRPQLRAFRIVWPLLALGLLLAFNAAFTSGFFDVTHRDGRLYGTPVDVLHRASPTVLLALGMTLVIATGGVDLSVGATMAIAATVAATYVRGPVDSGGLPTTHGGNVIIALALALVAALACGAWNGLLVAVFDIQPIIATLILMIAGRGLSELINGGQNVRMPADSFRWLHYLPAGGGAVRQHLLYPVPLDVLWAIAAILAVSVITRRTALGLFIESVGNNAVASRYAGVRAGPVKFLAYAACGVTAGAAGLLETADLDSASLGLGVTRELDAILAVSLGGTALAGGRFSLAGSVVGAVIISTLQKTILLTHIHGRQIPNEWFQVAEAVVIVGVCLVQSDAVRGTVSGLFKRR